MPPAPPLPPADASPAAVELDCRGLRCPLPVLRTRKALAGLPRGAVLRVSCTDPLAGLDIPHLVAETGDLLVGTGSEGRVQVFSIRRA